MININSIFNILSLYITFGDEIKDDIIEFTKEYYDNLKFKYNIVEDNDRLFAFCILNNIDWILNIENAKLTNKKAELLVVKSDTEIQNILNEYRYNIVSDVE